MKNTKERKRLNLLKKISAIIMMIVLTCEPIFAYEMTSKKVINGKEKVITETEINIYSAINNWQLNVYADIIDNTTFIDFRDLTGLLDFDCDIVGDIEDIIKNKNGVLLGTDSKTNAGFKLTLGNKGALINGQYVLLSAAPYYKEKFYNVPLKSILEHLGKNLTYDATTKTYIITNKGQAVPKIPTYPEKQITVISNHIRTSKNVKCIVVDDRLCVSTNDLYDIMGIFIRTRWVPQFVNINVMGDKRYAYSPSLRNISSYCSIKEKEIILSDEKKLVLPMPAFWYRGYLYFPFKAFVEEFGKTFTYNPNVNTVYIN